MYFASDNWAGAHPQIAENLSRHAAGFSAAYGTGDLDRQVERTFCEVFEREVAVFFVATGTAANALALSAHARPGGVAFCHREAHIVGDECGAPEFFTGGRLCAVDGPLGRFGPEALEAAIGRYPPGAVQAGQPAAVSITQATEAGTVYGLDEIEAIAQVARRHGLPLHMDGARFANALVFLDVSPAEMTWKRGVDVVSFGGTKNGCWCAEAVVFMNPTDARDFPFLRKRGAQLFSKSRFVAAQFEAYFRDGLWLETARHANAMAQRLADLVEGSPHARLGWAPEANEVFAIIGTETADALRAAGAAFGRWDVPHDALGSGIGEDEALYRFVASFATTPDDVDRVGQSLSDHGR